MINLLPPDIKQQYRFARRNRSLRKWINIGLFALLGAIILTGAGGFYLSQQTKSYDQQATAITKELDAQHLGDVQQQIKDISNNLQLVIKVLSQEVLFSQLLKRLGTVTPANTMLTNLSISQTQGAIDITAQTADYNSATQLQVNLSDPENQIFSKADIVSINCPTNSNGTSSTYGCTAVIRALFAKDNPFLFINGTKKAAS